MDVQAVFSARKNFSFNSRLTQHPSFAVSKNPSRQSRFAAVAGSRNKFVKCSMKSYKLSELTPTEVNGLKARPRVDFSSIFSTVHPIVDDVRSRGDAAVIEYTARFDKVTLDRLVENVSDLPDPELDPAVREAFDVAYDNIYAFHVAQKVTEKHVENMIWLSVLHEFSN